MLLLTGYYIKHVFNTNIILKIHILFSVSTTFSDGLFVFKSLLCCC